MDALELYSFLRDPKLLELMELNKTSNDIFDVVTLTENQNSQVLAWCMNPNEGHAQGDAVIRDFLEAAHAASEKEKKGDGFIFPEINPSPFRSIVS